MKTKVHDNRRSRRIQVLPLVPEERLSPESVSLLSFVLKELFQRRVLRMSLAGLRFSVKGIYFSSRPSLLWTFAQAEDPSFSFFFSNPYRRLEREFLLFLSEPIAFEEELLARAKREVLSMRKDSYFLCLSSLEADFAPLCPERERVLSFTLDDLKSSFELFRKNLSSSPLFFVSAKNPSTFSFPLAKRKEDVTLKDLSLPADVQDETLVLDLRHRPLASVSDVDDFELFYALFRREISLQFRRMMLPPIRYHIHPISSDRTLLFLTFAENNLSLLQNQLPFHGEKLPFLFDLRKEDLHQFEKDRLLVETDFSLFLKRLVELSLWSLMVDSPLSLSKPKEDSSFFDSVVLSQMAMARRR